MYKYSKIISLISLLIALVFIFSAFKGFHFWYAGFVLFLWIGFGSMNYRHETSLWLSKNKLKTFIIFYIFLALFSFIVDFVIGQKLTNLWIYPYYDSIDDWLRLYFIIYPFGGLAVLETIYFIAGIFGEKLSLRKRHLTWDHKFVDELDKLLLILMVLAPALFIFKISAYSSVLIVGVYLGWTIVATLKLRYHVAHWKHYLSILIGTFLISIFLHEIPNTSVFEWRYNPGPFLNKFIFDIPIYIIVGWYFLVMAVLRLWMGFTLNSVKK